MNQNPNRKLDRKPYNPTARYMVFIGIVLVMFGYLISGLVGLQLSSSEEYRRNAETRRTTKITLRGSRGMITDADAVILAKDEMIYNVTFYRDASQNTNADYASFTKAISEAIDIIEQNGSTLSVRFVIQRDPATGAWQFNFGSGVNEAVLQTRETQWREARSVDAAPPRASGPAHLAATMNLTAPGPAGYTLNLRLLEAAPLPDASQP